eukprot:6349459-Ditylum_brightwellii.AAC.2
MEWSEEFHTGFISKQTSNGSKEICDKKMRNLNGTLIQLRNDIEAGQKTLSKENLKSGTSQWSNSQKKMILNMSLIDGIGQTDNFVESMKDFMDQTTLAMSYEHLQDRLR